MTVAKELLDQDWREWEQYLKLPRLPTADFGDRLVMQYLCDMEGGHDMAEYIMKEMLFKPVKQKLAFDVGMSWAQEIADRHAVELVHTRYDYMKFICESLNKWIKEGHNG